MYLPRRSLGFPNVLQRTGEFYLCALCLCLKESDFGIVRVKEVSEGALRCLLPEIPFVGSFFGIVYQTPGAELVPTSIEVTDSQAAPRASCNSYRKTWTHMFVPFDDSFQH